VQTIYDQLAAFLVSRLRVPAELIGPDVTFEALELDSLALVELLATIEDEMGVRIDEEEIDSQFSMAQTVDLLTTRGVRE
jgi:acyl carrier protein